MAIVLFFNRSIVINGFKKLLNSLGVYTEVIKNVEITSTGYGEPGSWHIDKSAKWIEPNKAQITFNINSMVKEKGDHNKDVVLVLDVSGSMSGEKMEKARSDSIELVEYLLSNSKNRVAIITFDSSSTIVSSFSNDKNKIIEQLKKISIYGATNYDAALKSVDSLMKGYTKEKNRDVVTLFLTDGYPNIDTPNQVGTYELLKDKYPYMQINGIQYEMGVEIINEIKEITDSQWVANKTMLKNVLFESSISPTIYENFVVSDFIENEYFYVNSVDDIIVTRGTASLEEENGVQKVVWNLDDNFSTGSSAQMYINIDLKDNYLGTSKFLPTNKKEEISYKIEGEPQKEVKSNKTPVLKHSFDVVYDTNTPTGCKLSAIPKESHYVYETVTKKSDSLSCPGYLFRGWEIDGNDAKDITIINDDNFKMPDHDVTIRATWTKQSVVKSMNGTVHEKTTLFKVLKNEAESGGLAKEYTGAHQDSIKGVGSEKIYHYYAKNDEEGTAIQNKNNVIFAGMCWQMIRTTDTGGVKMIYNGEPDSDGKCGTAREPHVGYETGTSIDLSSNYYYGTSYTYNSSTKMFSLDGTITSATWDANTWSTLIGKYTCKSANQYGVCDTLYYIESYYNANKAYVLPLGSSANYSTLGNISYNNKVNSSAYVGYMYNEVYSYHHDTLPTSATYAKSFTYSNGVYKLNNAETIRSSSISLSASDDEKYKMNNAHYTCFNSTGECTTLSYVFYVDIFIEGYRPGSNYINLTGGESAEDALNKMLKADNINTTNSTIKSAIDAWYEKNLISYTDYLEDTIFCNNRSIKDLGGWNPNGGNIGDMLLFKDYGGSNDLSCTNVMDRFSVQNSKAKLKYPVGLMTVPEMTLLNSVNAQAAGQSYYLGTPGFTFNTYASVYIANRNGIFITALSASHGLRPAISLVAETEYFDGDGSMDHPFIVE